MTYSLPSHLARLTPLALAVAMSAIGTARAQPTVPSEAVVNAGGSSSATANDDKGAAEPRRSLETVVISATRRREPIRDVPMQVNVLNTEELQNGGARSLADYISTQPGVDLNSGGAPGIGGISMRGVTTGLQTIATVGVYVDDVATGSSSALALGGLTSFDMGLLDLNHIEVLRGPQGTLYGAGAMGGLLKYVTNEPDSTEFAGKVALTGAMTRSGRASTTTSGMVNLPIKEDLAALRVSAYLDRPGGFVDAMGLVRARDINRGESTGLRASLLLSPTSALKVRLTANTQKIDRDGRNLVAYDSTSGQPLDGGLTRSLTVAEPYRARNTLTSADVEFNFGWARLNSITSYQTSETQTTLDQSPTYAPLLKQIGISVVSAPFSLDVNNRKSTQEFRLTSKSDRQIEWLFGFFYDYERGEQRQGAGATLHNGSAAPNLLTVVAPSTYREAAFYGDLTWKFANGISVTGGVRTARNKQTLQQSLSGLFVGLPTVQSGESKDSSTTYLLTAGYALSQYSSVYGRVATGYRPGGPNISLRDAKGNLLVPDSFEPDTLTSYELGYKADLLDRKLSLELSGYAIEWHDVQQNGSLGSMSFLLNGGSARIRGLELSAKFVPSLPWTLTAAGSLVDAALAEAWPGLGGKVGDRMPNTARFSASLSGRYAFNVAQHPAHLGVVQRIVGKRRAGFAGGRFAPDYELPAYSLTDLQAGVDFDRMSITLFVRNALDKRAQLGVYPGGGAPTGAALVSMSEPRTIGLTAKLTF